MKNHGVPDTVLEKMSNNLEYFFRLPQDEKKKGLFGRAPAPAKIASIPAF